MKWIENQILNKHIYNYKYVIGTDGSYYGEWMAYNFHGYREWHYANGTVYKRQNVPACSPPTPVGLHFENVCTYPPQLNKKMLLQYITKNVFYTTRSLKFLFNS